MTSNITSGLPSILPGITKLKIDGKDTSINDIEKNNLFVSTQDADLNGDKKISDNEKGITFIVDKSGQNRKIELTIDASKIDKSIDLSKMVTYGNISPKRANEIYDETPFNREIHPINIKDAKDASVTAGIIADEADMSHMGEVVAVCLKDKPDAVVIGYDEEKGETVITPPVKDNIVKQIGEEKYKTFAEGLNGKLAKPEKDKPLTQDAKDKNANNLIKTMQTYGIAPDFVNRSGGSVMAKAEGKQNFNYITKGETKLPKIALENGVNFYNSNGNFRLKATQVRPEDCIDGATISVGANEPSTIKKGQLNPEIKEGKYNQEKINLTANSDTEYYQKWYENVMPTTNSDAKAQAYSYFSEQQDATGNKYVTASDKYDPKDKNQKFKIGTSYASPSYAIQRESQEGSIYNYIKNNFLGLTSK
jgi:hypothetical protein